jgi:hypothetical protein
MTGSLIRLALAISRGDNKRDKGTVRERDWSGVILQWILVAGDPS